MLSIVRIVSRSCAESCEVHFQRESGKLYAVLHWLRTITPYSQLIPGANMFTLRTLIRPHLLLTYASLTVFLLIVNRLPN